MPEENNSPEQKMFSIVEEAGRVFSNQGIPFKTEAAARAAMTNKDLSHEEYKVQSYEDGYILVKKDPKPKEKYYRVQFNMKSNPNDEEDVTLGVNGELLVIQRGVQVIIPGRFKECADHATYPHFTQKPNESRKQVGTVMIFPYSTLGEATESEYRKQLREGNKKTRAALAEAQKLIQ